jgi:D-serine deaminase-like pyridoxal phosphate-dependent protein
MSDSRLPVGSSLATAEYSFYKNYLDGQRLSLAWLDWDLLLENAKMVIQRASSKPVRIATKSIRSRAVIEALLNWNQSAFAGLMCYSAQEALWLNSFGFNHLVVAYPVWNALDIQEFVNRQAAGQDIALMIDSEEHITRIESCLEASSQRLQVWLDVDMSTELPGIWFGVKRSSIRTMQQLEQVLKRLQSSKHIELIGFMGYEAQIAGLGDQTPGKALLNPLIRMLKRYSEPRSNAWRREAVERIRQAGFDLRYINGGGTGSLESSAAENINTEVAAGSGFFQPLLFDHYDHFQARPAAGFALEVRRMPEPGIITLQGGGYIASGPFGVEKVPQPYLPEGLKLLPDEMAGEVQTPLRLPKQGEARSLQHGDPVFFRHAKAGELCEHFRSLHVIQRGKALETWPTYRGEGQCFS